MTKFNFEQLTDIANGGCLLGAGGGGNLASALRLIGNSFPPDATVDVASVEEASASDGLTAVVAYAMAPASFTGASIKPAVKALLHLQRLAGRPIARVLPIETGAVSSVVPCLVAHALGLQVVDADGAGRAAPQLTSLTYSVAPGLSYDPMVLGAANESTDVLNQTDYGPLMNVFAGVMKTSTYSGTAAIAMWLMRPDQIAAAVPIRNTLTLTREVGAVLRADQAPVDAVIALLNSRGRKTTRLFRGSIGPEARSMSTPGIYDQGQIRYQGDGTTGSADATVYFQNESIIAWKSDQPAPLACMPDSICGVTLSGRPISNSCDLAPLAGTDGRVRVDLLKVEAWPVLRDTPKILESYTQTLAGAGYAGRVP